MTFPRYRVPRSRPAARGNVAVRQSARAVSLTRPAMARAGRCPPFPGPPRRAPV